MKMLVWMAAVCAATVAAAAVADPLSVLMPRPKSCEPGAGAWVYDSDEISRDPDAVPPDDPEGYTLTVTPEGARWSGNERYAMTTLRQLAALGGGQVPACEIRDAPTFRIRGVMHDTGRNWQPVGLLKEQLRRMADYKLNAFQWHITDNHGWRLESKRYPELSDPENLDRTDGFYTQDEFRDLIAYAATLGITVIPELDVPGHTAAFRRAFGLKRMNEPKVREIVGNLFAELASLLDPAVTPYIHIGSDEVKGHERVPDAWIAEWVGLLEAKGFSVIAWAPGQYPKGLRRPLIRQYWTGRQTRRPKAGEAYIDSQSSYYINHVDPLELLAPAAYQMPCLTGRPEDRLGAVFAVWHDDAVADPKDIYTMNPVFPAVVLYSDSFWNGREKDLMAFYGNLPDPRDPEFALAEDLERRTLAQKPFFKGLPFDFYRQTQMRWRMAETAERLPFADLPWGERIIAQGTVFPQHYFFRQSNLTDGRSGCVWLGTVVVSDADRTVALIADAMNYSRSGGRYRDLPLRPGAWNAKGAEILLNGEPVPPPVWNRPGLTGRGGAVEIPMTDEVWSVRPPVRVKLRKGRNELLIRLPKGGWKWGVTCFFPEPEGLEFLPPDSPGSEAAP